MKASLCVSLWCSRRLRYVAGFILSRSLCCGGCAAFKPRSTFDAFAKFSTATSATAEQVTSSLADLNKVERTALVESEISQGHTPSLRAIEAVQVYNQADIDVLSKAAKQLADYAKLLQTLAYSDAPENIAARVKVLGSSIAEFQIGSNAVVPDSIAARNARQAAGALSIIIAEASKWIFQYHVNATVDKVIIAADPHIQRIGTALENGSGIHRAVCHESSQYTRSPKGSPA